MQYEEGGTFREFSRSMRVRDLCWHLKNAQL